MDKRAKTTELFQKLKQISEAFEGETGEYDIYTNSKYYEILIANYFGHRLLKGHSGSRDAEDAFKMQLEYKHYKKSSSNHTWTFNDYSGNTLKKLKDTVVYFVYIDDSESHYSKMLKWYYKVQGKYISEYISEKAPNLKNERNMINISAHQLETELKCKAVKIECDENSSCKQYDSYLQAISEIVSKLEKLNGVNNLLTSNKIWELFLANYLRHQVNSHQGGNNGSYDASVNGKIFEYKIINFYKYPSWCFEDLSDNVFKRLESMDAIVVARVNKRRFNVCEGYALNPKRTVALLKRKLEQKEYEYALKNKRLNRRNIHLSKKELEDNNLIINKNVLF